MGTKPFIVCTFQEGFGIGKLERTGYISIIFISISQDMVISAILLIFGSIIASGVLFEHKRVLTFMAAAGVIWEGQWLLLTLLSRVLLRGVSSNSVFMAGSILLLIAWLFVVKKFKFPKIKSYVPDLCVLLVLGVVLLAAWLVVSVNGWQGDSWVMHGFYNGDTTTFVSLVQRSLLTDGLADENPFAGGGALEYPTLLHAGAAGIIAGVEGGWLGLLPAMTLLQVLLTVPIFFLLWDVIFPEPKEKGKRWFGVSSRAVVHGAQAGVVLYVLALSWDGYIYPQGHFFLTGLFLLLSALLVRGYEEEVRSEFLWIVPASLIALVLMLSNAVTGTAAVALVSVFYLLRAGDKGRAFGERLVYSAGVPAWLALFLFFTPGNGSFGIVPHFSYTAAVDMMRLAPVIIILGLAVFWYLKEKTLVAAMVAVLTTLAAATFVFSTRDIVVANASRFFYHAVLVGFPLIIYPLVRGWFLLKRELINTTHSFVQLGIGWFMAAVFAGILLMPAGASVLSAHDNLMFKDETVVSSDMLNALEWIKGNSNKEEIFIASPGGPWVIPFFAGRMILRTDYWLSPGDELESKVVKAFAGNEEAQEEILERADYLVLTDEEQRLWGSLDKNKLFENSEAAIYGL